MNILFVSFLFFGFVIYYWFVAVVILVAWNFQRDVMVARVRTEDGMTLWWVKRGLFFDDCYPPFHSGSG
jgi:hypothetical protein